MRKDSIDGVAYVANHGPHKWGIHWYDSVREGWWEPQSFFYTKRAAVEVIHEDHEREQACSVPDADDWIEDRRDYGSHSVSEFRRVK